MNRKERKARRLAHELELRAIIKEVYQGHIIEHIRDGTAKSMDSRETLLELDRKLREATWTLPWYKLTDASDMTLLRRVCKETELELLDSAEWVATWFIREADRLANEETTKD